MQRQTILETVELGSIGPIIAAAGLRLTDHDAAQIVGAQARRAA
jgi:hypothetical protein